MSEDWTWQQALAWSATALVLLFLYAFVGLTLLGVLGL